MSTYCKYYKQKEQISIDGGVTWYDVIPYNYQKGSLYENCSFDCGYPIGTRWETTGEICIGHDLYELQTQQITYDSGNTWNDMPYIRQGELIEVGVANCDYKVFLTYSGGSTYEVLCELDRSIKYTDVTAGGNSDKVISATIGQCAEIIDNSAFQYCINLGEITIPSNITSIGTTFGDYHSNGAFMNCTSLSSVTLSDSVEFIGDFTFDGCYNLSSINLPSGLTTIGRSAFSNCSGLTNVIIPDSVTNLGNGVFYLCTNLESVHLPSGITSIPLAFFNYCYSLSEITIPETVTSIGDTAFFNCTGLTSVEIPSGVTKIGVSAFNQCSGLTSITVNAINPPSLGENAFRYTNDCDIFVPCESVAEYKATNGWSDYADRIKANYCDTSVKLKFDNKEDEDIYCTVLSGTVGYRDVDNNFPDGSGSNIHITDVEIGDCVDNLYATFYGCSNLSSVTLSEEVTTLSSFYRTGVGTYGTFGKCTSLSSMTLPNSITTIGDRCFYGCNNLRNINIPSGATSIGTYAFSGSGITGKVEIPSGVTSIEIGTFAYCFRITEVELPSTTTSIGYHSFDYCSNISAFTVNAIIPPTLNASAFTTINQNMVIYVPCESVDIYKAASGWSRYASRIQCKPKFKATYSGGTTYSAACDSSTTLTYTDTHPSGYTASAMTDAIIGDCVTSIDGWGTLGYLDSLSSVTIPNSVTTIGGGAFVNNNSLTSITIPDSVTTIGGYVFMTCYNLANITIGSGVTSIGNSAFEYCSSLTSITVNATTPPSLGTNVLNYTDISIIYVPSGSVAAYKAASGWSTYASIIQPIPT